MNPVLEIGGVKFTDLAEKYGTPLYVYDEDQLIKQCQSFKRFFQSPNFETEILYASKAFSCLGMMDLVHRQGLSVDVVSLGELYTALQAGMEPEHIYFHGNNKTRDEIEYALSHKVQTFFVDNLQEAALLVRLCRDIDYTLHVILRINPCIEAHTHEYIQTANIDSKFGIDIHLEDQILELIHTLMDCPHIQFDGFHAHIGSQIFEKEAYVKEIETCFAFAASMQERGVVCHTLDLGGGFAVHYTEQDCPIPIPDICNTILEACEVMQRRFQTRIKRILIEPGRSIVAEAGSTLYTIGFSKRTPHRTYLFVDGGMSDNIRPSLYQARYSADLANHMDKEKIQTVCVAGKCCESGDILIDEVMLPSFVSGDLLVVYSTGAYGFSMFNNYNRNLRPAVVFCRQGRSRLIVQRETLEELLRGDVRDADSVS